MDRVMHLVAIDDGGAFEEKKGVAPMTSNASIDHVWLRLAILTEYTLLASHQYVQGRHLTVEN